MGQVKNDNISLRAPKDLDNRKGYWLDGAWTLFNSPEQALLHPDIVKYRHPGMTITINDGTNQFEYWFVGGISDENFILKTVNGLAITKGEIALSGAPVQIDWETAEVPGEAPLTYADKHGDPRDVWIKFEAPNDLNPNMYSPILNYGFTYDAETMLLIFDAGGNQAKYTIFSGGSGTIIPPTPGFWSDSNTWVDTDTWQD